MVKASDCGSDMREFDPHNPPHKKADDFCHRLFYMRESEKGRTHTRQSLVIEFGGFWLGRSVAQTRSSKKLMSDNVSEANTVFCEAKSKTAKFRTSRTK